MVRAQGSMQPDIHFGGEDERAPCFYGEWWRPKSQQDIVPEAIQYAKRFLTTQTWERDPGFVNQLEWHKAQPSMYSWVFRGKLENLEKTGVKIWKKALEAVKAHIARLYAEKTTTDCVQEDEAMLE